MRAYFSRLRDFSRNARLLLISNVFSLKPPMGGLAWGLWMVLFNLYLLEQGYDIAFIGTLLAINAVAHAVAIFPLGLFCDVVGRRRAFLVGGLLDLFMRLAMVSTESVPLLFAASAGAGVTLALVHVAWEPFMAESSTWQDRTHLFSINRSLGLISILGGSLLAGGLPLALAGSFDLGSSMVRPFRLTLFLAIALNLVSLLPIYFTRETRRPISASISLSKIQSRATIGKFMIVSGLTGLAFGFIQPFFNLFFSGKLGASADQIGVILALGSLAGAVASLAAPVLTERWGRVATLSLTTLLAIPFTLGMAFSPGYSLVILSFLLMMGFRTIGYPVAATFRMEAVLEQERASTVGLTHLSFDILFAPSQYLAGQMMNNGQFWLPYTLTAFLAVVIAVAYWVFFRRLEPEVAARLRTLEAGERAADSVREVLTKG